MAESPVPSGTDTASSVVDQAAYILGRHDLADGLRGGKGWTEERLDQAWARLDSERRARFLDTGPRARAEALAAAGLLRSSAELAEDAADLANNPAAPGCPCGYCRQGPDPVEVTVEACASARTDVPQLVAVLRAVTDVADGLERDAHSVHHLAKDATTAGGAEHIAGTAAAYLRAADRIRKALSALTPQETTDA